jgi:hypothetical protein
MNKLEVIDLEFKKKWWWKEGKWIVPKSVEKELKEYSEIKFLRAKINIYLQGIITKRADPGEKLQEYFERRFEQENKYS